MCDLYVLLFYYYYIVEGINFESNANNHLQGVHHLSIRYLTQRSKVNIRTRSCIRIIKSSNF